MPSAHPHARSCRWRTGDSHAARLGRAQEERRLPPSQNRSGSYRSSSLLHHLDVGMIGGHERPDILARVDPDVAKDRPRRLQKPPDRVRNFMAVIDSEGLEAKGPRHLHEVGTVGEEATREILPGETPQNTNRKSD